MRRRQQRDPRHGVRLIGVPDPNLRKVADLDRHGVEETLLGVGELQGVQLWRDFLRDMAARRERANRALIAERTDDAGRAVYAAYVRTYDEVLVWADSLVASLQKQQQRLVRDDQKAEAEREAALS